MQSIYPFAILKNMNGRITPKQVAAQTGKTVNRIQQMCVRGEIAEPLAKKIGSNWWLSPKAVDFIRSIPERRGRPRKRKAAAIV